MKKEFFSKTLRYCFHIALCAAMALSSCSKESEEDFDTDDDKPVSPNDTVDDPTGTIPLAMTFGSTTDINGVVRLTDDGNFKTIYDYDYITTIGACKGLGNVTTIPVSGWSNSVRAIKGYGYVVYRTYQKTYTRIYVESEITSTESVGGIYESTQILGYNVKYQSPFYGLDTTPIPELTTVTFDAYGYQQQAVTLTNTGLVSFTFTQTGGEDWLRVETCSTQELSFLVDGVMLTVFNDNTGSKSRTATVTLTTKEGKSADITVTQSGAEPFIEPGRSSVYFYRAGSSESVGFSSNLSIDQLKAISSEEWCKAEIIDNSATMAKRNAKVKFVDDEPYVEKQETRAGSELRSYSLQLTVDENSGEERECEVTLSGEDVEPLKITIEQEGLIYQLSDFNTEVTPNTESITISTNIPAENLKFTGWTDWCELESVEQQDSEKVRLNINVSDNDTFNERTCTVAVTSDISTKTATITLIQKGKYFNVSESDLWFDRKAGSYSITIQSSNVIKPVSSADWLTITNTMGDTYIIRCTATTEDRTANISFEGFDEQIIVHQSKYAVGDDYNEDGVIGLVHKMEGEYRVIYRDLKVSLSWSIENIFIGATDENDGRNNWEKVTSIPGWQDLYPAFAEVDKLNVDGVTGWYLPAINESITLNSWSSTEISSDKAYNSWYDGVNKRKVSTTKDVKIRVPAFHRF